MPTSAQNLDALRREIARVGGRRNPILPYGGQEYLSRAIALASQAGRAARGEGYVIPTDNFWYAWLIAALARGVVRNETRDSFTKQLSGMTLREIAKMADTDPSFYDT